MSLRWKASTASWSEFAGSIRHLIDRISTATYGYGGLFSDRDVDEAALDQLRLFDESLMTGVDELKRPITALEQAVTAKTDLAAPAREGTAATRTILARLDLRNEVIETGRPASEESIREIRDILSPKSPEEQGPPPAFDLLYWNGFDLRGVPLKERRKLLEEVVRPGTAVRLSETFDVDPRQLLEAVRSQGLEGIVAKRSASLYQERRSADWVKVKATREQEFVLCGYTHGERDFFGAHGFEKIGAPGVVAHGPWSTSG